MFTPADAAELLDRYGALGVMTHRQEQVMRLIADGKSVDEIAAELGIAVGTVRVHLDRARVFIRIHEVRLKRGR